MSFIGSDSTTENEYFDQSDNSVNTSTETQDSGEDLFQNRGFNNEITVTDGGSFDLVDNLISSIEGMFSSALDYGAKVTEDALGAGKSQQNEVLDFAGSVYTESANLAGQATVGANFSTASVSKNMMYVAGAAALLFVASKVFK